MKADPLPQGVNFPRRITMWPRLSEEARVVVATAVEEGPRWPGNYYGDSEERACRLFESWAFAQAAGMPGYSYSDDGMSVHRIFGAIYSGAFADDLISTGPVRVPFAVKAARGMLAPPPPSPPLADRMATAAWRWARNRMQKQAA